MRMTLTNHLPSLAAALLVTSAACGQVQRFELTNGLKVIMRPVAQSSKVALVTLFDVGEIHDPPGRSGLGHLVEHVYVTAAAGTTPPATADEWFARYDFQANAQTGRDYTVVATVFPRGDLDAEIAEAAARMGDLRVVQADLDREKPRMARELANMYGGIPSLAALNLTANRAHPLPSGARKGGVMEQLQDVSVEEVAARHRDYYKPANARLILVGGFDTASARALIAARFGAIDRGKPPPAPAAAPPAALDDVQRARVAAPAGPQPAGVATLAYLAPAPGSEDFAAFLMLTARAMQASLPQMRLARERASGVMPMSYAPLDMPDLVFFSAEVEPGQTDEQAAAALRARIAEITDVPPDEPLNEFFLYKSFGPMFGLTQLPETAIVMNPYGAAFTLGRVEQMGLDPDALAEALGNLTLRDLRRVATDVYGPGRDAAAVVRVK